ncbi:tRNA wybutosine-synthesizing protein 4 [Geodia barretti]|uniref:tRNA wybutosine-synthesizing protein 4 n=1 Tax=Geodia barretti TaxID=519541 RepID=A0AA35WEJ5_GEOBA|nr:tRNA wybutosine-synthesizing protein 4 [Geodia barretti]
MVCDLSLIHLLYNRYGHGSCVLSDGSIVIIGGYGESSFGGITPHSRLNDVLKLQLDTEGWKLCSLDNVHGSGPGVLMHHTATAIANGTAVFVIGGRTSPACPNKKMFVLRENEPFSDAFEWSEIVLHPESAVMEPCWRHTANCIHVDNEEVVLIVGGSCVRTCALVDIYKLNTASWRLEKLCVSLPEGRCFHSCVSCWEGLMICGGMDSSMQPISSCLYLRHSLPDVWNLSPVHFSPPIPPKYSMSAAVTGDHVILSGGVGLEPSPDLIVINLALRIWFGAMIFHEKEDILLEKHTCHLLAGQKLVLLGGGGNCFSFGTHFNCGICTIDTNSLF